VSAGAVVTAALEKTTKALSQKKKKTAVARCNQLNWAQRSSSKNWARPQFPG